MHFLSCPSNIGHTVAHSCFMQGPWGMASESCRQSQAPTEPLPSPRSQGRTLDPN